MFVIRISALPAGPLIFIFVRLGIFGSPSIGLGIPFLFLPIFFVFLLFVLLLIFGLLFQFLTERAFDPISSPVPWQYEAASQQEFDRLPANVGLRQRVTSRIYLITGRFNPCQYCAHSGEDFQRLLVILGLFLIVVPGVLVLILGRYRF